MSIFVSFGSAKERGNKNITLKGPIFMEMYSDILKELRQDRGLTQDALAKKLGLSTPNYRRYENAYGNMPLDVLIRLALVFETSTDYILGLTGNPTPYPRRSRLP